MTRIDFYVLNNSADTHSRYLFCCQLIEKIVSLGHRICVRMDAQNDAEQLDDLLWSFKPEAYLPHLLLSSAPDADTVEELNEVPVVIVCKNVEYRHGEVLINLRADIPGSFSDYMRYIEIVNQDAKRLQASRESFAFFRQRSYAIETHKLNR